MKSGGRNWWGVAGYIFLATLATIGIGIIVALAMGQLRKGDVFLPEIGLTVLLITGLSALLIVLSAVASTFAALNLADSTQALGLPEGSVRAVIALSLILIFSILALFLYSQLGEMPETLKYTGISQDILNTIPKEQIVSIEPRKVGNDTVFDVQRLVEKSKTSEDFAKQILTTVSTLVVAVAGFYFGSRAVATARGVTESSEPLIRYIQPNSGKQGERLEKVEIFGKNFQSPKTVRLVKGSDKIECEDITSSDTVIKCEITIDDNKPQGKWNLLVVNDDGGEDTFDELFEVLPKAA